MTDRQIVLLFEQHNPKTIQEMQELGFYPKYISQGISRKAYRLSNRLVVKTVINERSDWELKQSISEIEFLENFLYSPAINDSIRQELLPHIAPLYYGNKKTGVILTEFIPEKITLSHDSEYVRLQRKFGELGVSDMHLNNFRVNDSGRLIAIDFGASPSIKKYQTKELKYYCNSTQLTV